MTNLRVSHIRADPMNRQDLVELNLLTYNCAIVLCDQVRAGGMQGREGRGGGASDPSGLPASSCCLLLLPSSHLPGLLLPAACCYCPAPVYQVCYRSLHS